MHPPDKGARKRIRYFKGRRRLEERVAGHRCTWACFKAGKCDTMCHDDVYPGNWWCERHNGSLEGRGKRFAQLADYPQTCSCMGCGNPRRAYEPCLTRQEFNSRERDDTNVNSVRFARLYDQLEDK